MATVGLEIVRLDDGGVILYPLWEGERDGSGDTELIVDGSIVELEYDGDFWYYIITQDGTYNVIVQGFRADDYETTIEVGNHTESENSFFSRIYKNGQQVKTIYKAESFVYKVYKGDVLIFDNALVVGYLYDDVTNKFYEKKQVGNNVFEQGEELQASPIDSTEIIIQNRKKYYKAYYQITYKDGHTEITDIWTMGTFIEDVQTYVNVDLNNQWKESTIRYADKSIYTTFMSSSNYNVSNGWSRMKVSFYGYETITFLYGSYAEGSYDYTLVGNLDADMSSSTSTSTGTTSSVWKMSSNGKQSSSAPNIEVSYTNLDPNVEHFIWVAYRKDSSVNNDDDRGYFAVRTEQINEIKNPHT